MEVFNQRLEQEYNASVIVTAPTVPYKAVLSSPKLIKVRAISCPCIFWPYTRGGLVLYFYSNMKVLTYLEALQVVLVLFCKYHTMGDTRGFSE